MILNPCTREKEVGELLERGHWPQACPAELSAHVANCRSCGDLVLVTQAFRQARSQATAAAPLVSPGVLWWRAQLRRRNAAVERIGRPILGAQIFALCITLVIAIAFAVFEARNGVAWLTWLEGLPQAGSLSLASLWPSNLFGMSWSLYVLIPSLATLALLCGAVVYLASEKQ